MRPGPSNLHPCVRRVMSTPLVGHLSFVELMDEVQELQLHLPDRERVDNPRQRHRVGRDGGHNHDPHSTARRCRSRGTATSARRWRRWSGGRHTGRRGMSRSTLTTWPRRSTDTAPICSGSSTSGPAPASVSPLARVDRSRSRARRARRRRHGHLTRRCGAAGRRVGDRRGVLGPAELPELSARGRVLVPATSSGFAVCATAGPEHVLAAVAGLCETLEQQGAEVDPAAGLDAARRGLAGG